MSITALLLYLPQSMGLATSALVGRALGEANLAQAKSVATTALRFSFLVTLLIAVTMQPFLHTIAYFYSSDAAEAEQIVWSLRVYLLVLLVVDSCQVTL